jgi:hypothetical protein
MLMKLIRSAILFGLAAATAAASINGCSSDPQLSPGTGPSAPSNGERGTGTVGMELQIAPGITLGMVQYTITNPTLSGFAPIVSTVDASGSQTVGFSLTLPVASGYTLSLSAMDSNEDPCSGGPVTFSVLANQTSDVSLTLVCTRTIDGGVIGPDVSVGTVVVTGDVELDTVTSSAMCAAASSLVASPNRAPVGQAVSLSAAGIDANNQSSDVTLTWAATGGAGTLSATTGTSNMLQCSSSGTETVTVTAAISGGGQSCPGTGSLSAVITCGTPSDAGQTPDAAVDSGAATGTPDATADAGAAPDVASGPVVPCTMAGQSGCLQCVGSANGICTATEAIIVNRDIAHGNFTGTTLTNSSCYSCMVNNGGLDDTTGDQGNECGDVTGSATLTGITGTAACLATLQCIVTNACDTGSPPSPISCLCGSAVGSACLTSGAANGPCLQDEINGLDIGTGTVLGSLVEGDPTSTQKAFATKALGSGQANSIEEFAGSNCQSACTP